jgi:hypothetical protein
MSVAISIPYLLYVFPFDLVSKPAPNICYEVKADRFTVSLFQPVSP